MSRLTAPVAPTRPGWFRRHSTSLLIGAALVVATGFVVVHNSRVPHSGALDPANADPSGAQAVARVLADNGIEVDVVRDADTLDDTTIDDDTIVVVTSIDNLGPSTADRLVDDVGDAPLLLVDPPVGSLGLFGLDEGVRVHRREAVAGRCDDPRFDDLEIRVDKATAYPHVDDSCFATEDGDLLLRPGSGPEVLGAGTLLANNQITRADNAAVALRLLGGHNRLIWYVPDVGDLIADDGVGLGSLLPRWLGPGLWLAALAMIAVIWWRGRRLGPLVTEPLPVTVTAIESTESRGRLYRKVSDRAHAAEALRRAARSRIAEYLRLPPSSTDDADVLIRDVAAHGDLDPDRVRDLLSPRGGLPRTDKDLTQLANDLAELDREVRRS
jgi:hypothetical protein